MSGSPIPAVGALVAAAGVLNATVRLLLCLLALHAGRRALADGADGAARRQRLAVLRAVLAAVCPRRQRTEKRLSRSRRGASRGPGARARSRKAGR